MVNLVKEIVICIKAIGSFLESGIVLHYEEVLFLS
jgi:hypothetical protein